MHKEFDKRIFSAAVLLWIIGIFYYTNFRCGLAFFSISQCSEAVDPLPQFPTFIHILAMSLLSSSFFGKDKLLQFASIWCLINFLFEVGQGFSPALGYFDWGDVTAIPLAWLLLVVIHKLYGGTASNPSPFLQGFIARMLLTILGVASISATSPPIDRRMFPAVPEVEPIELDIGAYEPRSLLNPGKIYRKDKWLFVNEKRQGIHIIDNSDPANPKKLAFLFIPDNTELAIRNNKLYANSGRDLLVLDISRLPYVKLIKRVDAMLDPVRY